MEFVPLVALGVLLLQVVNLIKYIRARDANGITTILAAWVAGLVVVLLVAQTDFAEGFSVGGNQSLADLNFASLVFIGLTIASVGGYLVDIKKAVDTSDSAKVPPLVE
jgi:hypothetical protein